MSTASISEAVAEADTAEAADMEVVDTAVLEAIFKDAAKVTMITDEVKATTVTDEVADPTLLDSSSTLKKTFQNRNRVMS